MLSNITERELLEIVTDAIPLSLELTSDEIKAKIKRAMLYINSFYALSDKLNGYRETSLCEFYNSANLVTNVRENSSIETRWQIVPNSVIKPVKMLSCMLKSILPADVALPADIEFVQNIKISVQNAEDINTLVPSKNRGAIGFLSGQGFFTVLSLDPASNTFDQIQIIDCLITYVRQVELPLWLDESRGLYVDIFATDVNWLTNLVLSYCNASHISAQVKREIREHQDKLLY